MVSNYVSPLVEITRLLTFLHILKSENFKEIAHQVIGEFIDVNNQPARECSFLRGESKGINNAELTKHRCSRCSNTQFTITGNDLRGIQDGSPVVTVGGGHRGASARDATPEPPLPSVSLARGLG